MSDSSNASRLRTIDPVATPVWDWPVRVVHWAMVICLAGLVVTGLRKGDAMAWHMRLGEVLLALVLFRIAWGFVGSGNARFTAFLRGPRAALRYARSRLKPPHEIHVTHNPVGGWMVVALLVTMLVQASIGLFANDDVFWDGPLAKTVAKETSDLLSSLHRRLAWVVVGLAVAHIVAVFVYLVAFRENLIRPMVVGKKHLPAGVGTPEAARASSVKAIALFILCVAIVAWIVRKTPMAG
ncbi:MAG: cytochrome b/b6 domain-containing protein [Burkholderiales bacterium]|nr:cytochrome b/b6 domain-containing protein [Burkholderiales bacterium]